MVPEEGKRAVHAPRVRRHVQWGGSRVHGHPELMARRVEGLRNMETMSSARMLAWVGKCAQRNKRARQTRATLWAP